MKARRLLGAVVGDPTVGVRMTWNGDTDPTICKNDMSNFSHSIY